MKIKTLTYTVNVNQWCSTTKCGELTALYSLYKNIYASIKMIYKQTVMCEI